MTDSQARFQTIMENQRHNLEMERMARNELEVSKRNVAVKESEEARASDLHAQQKKLMWSQATNNFGSTVKNASETVVNIFKAARGFFGLIGDAASFANNVGGGLGGGYYQGSLFE